MTEIDVLTEWQKLCEEHESARTAYLQAFASVNQKFAAIGREASRINPTDDELSNFESTWQTWEDVKKRMDKFVRHYA